MNKPTKEEMLKAWSDCYSCYSSHLYGAPKYGPLYEAIRALISASPEAGEQRGEVEQLRVQLAGCSTAALGWNNKPAKQGDYGWSASYQDVLELRQKYEALVLSPAPLPEVEAARGWLGDLESSVLAYGTDEIVAPEGWRERMSAALSTIQAALTEARQPKVVSREWVENTIDGFPGSRCVIEANVLTMLKELGITVGAATFRQRAENSRNPK